MADVALGIVPHTGWAVVVAVADDPVRLVHRDRFELVGTGDDTFSRFAWHAAQQAGLSPADAEALAARVGAAAADAAAPAMAAFVGRLRDDGHHPVGAAVLGEPRDVGSAEEILARHMLLHAAEGELYREVLSEAAEAAGLDVLVVAPASVDLAPLAPVLADLGRAAGPPWRKDHKVAVVAALRALRG